MSVEICANCGRVILSSEQAYICNGKIVCANCDIVLRSKQTIQPNPLPKPAVSAKTVTLPSLTSVNAASQPAVKPPIPMKFSLSAGDFVGNLLWFIFGGGILLALGWLFLGAIMYCTIIGIPFGIAAFRIVGFVAFPFGKQLVDARLLGEERIRGTAIANILWVILAGLWLAIGHTLAGIFNLLCFIFILPVFWAMANFKLAAVCFAPLGKRAVPKVYAQTLEQVYAQRQADVVAFRPFSKTTPSTPAVTAETVAVPSSPVPTKLTRSRLTQPVQIIVAIVGGIAAICAGVVVVFLLNKHGLTHGSWVSVNQATKTQRYTSTTLNINHSKSASISTTDLEGMMQRARELTKEVRDELAEVQSQNQGNDIALRSALDRALAESKNKVEQEFAKLQGQTVQWRFTVKEVKQYLGEALVYLNEPQGGFGDDGTGLHFCFGKGGGCNFLRVGQEVPLSLAEKLSPGDPLIVKGSVRVKVGMGEVGPFNIGIQLTDIKVERANYKSGVSQGTDIPAPKEDATVEYDIPSRLKEGVNKLSQRLKSSNELLGKFDDYKMIIPPDYKGNETQYEIGFLNPAGALYVFRTTDGGKMWYPFPPTNPYLKEIGEQARKKVRGGTPEADRSMNSSVAEPSQRP